MPSARTHSGIVTFLLRVAGKEATQLEEQKRFRKNLNRHSGQQARLSVIIEDIERINREAKKKHEDLQGYANSVRPPKRDQ